MSTLTSELALVIAQDADDTADYLTLTAGLAGSLNILDGLFNATTGHNHNGAHQGGSLAFTNGLDVSIIRFTNGATLGPTATGNMLRFQSTEVQFSGNARVEGTLNATGPTTLVGATASSLTVSGTSTLGVTNVGALTTTGLTVNGNENVSGTLTASILTTTGRITAGTDFVLKPAVSTMYFGEDGTVTLQRAGAIGGQASPLIVTNPGGGLWIRDKGLTLYTPTDPQPGGSQTFRTIEASTRSAGTYGGGEVHIALRLFVDGDIYSGTYVHGISFIQNSDMAIKQNAVVIPDVDCMTRVRNQALPVYSYEIPPAVEGGITPTPTDVGFSAADVYAVAPEFAALDENQQPVGVTYSNMAALLWGALRQLDARVQTLEAA